MTFNLGRAVCAVVLLTLVFSSTTLLANLDSNENDPIPVFNTIYSQQRIPVGLIFINAGCRPCVPVTQFLDTYIPAQANDVALIGIHTGWPSSDAMYLYNQNQANALMDDYGVSGVAHLFIDGIDTRPSGQGGVNIEEMEALFESQKMLTSPMTMHLHFDNIYDKTYVVVQVVEEIELE